jgi:hypothetical protein
LILGVEKSFPWGSISHKKKLKGLISLFTSLLHDVIIKLPLNKKKTSWLDLKAFQALQYNNLNAP